MAPFMSYNVYQADKDPSIDQAKVVHSKGKIKRVWVEKSRRDTWTRSQPVINISVFFKMDNLSDLTAGDVVNESIYMFLSTNIGYS